ncbi:hypothetical protein Taro_041355 [Colocasia esculenta]|uniref:CBS domain-containing protein n=1 Tax=Colocasia esculenta TaxID=4460 RepID=A0A843WL97_COLES|nr:hypothetical protein [Colocasia esculenta]
MKLGTNTEPFESLNIAYFVMNVLSVSIYCSQGLFLTCSVLDCMEAFSKGVHRALVPMESHVENVVAAELVESSPGYRMLTQMDVVSFLRAHNTELDYVISYTVGELGAVNENVLSITTGTRVIDALKSMRAASLSSVPIVEAHGNVTDEHVLLDGKGKKLVSTFSATDLRACPIDLLQQWLNVSVVEFKDKASSMHGATAPTVLGADRARCLVTCRRETTLAQVIEEAVASRVHRVWVVDVRGRLLGLVSLSDMLRVIREALLVAERET